MRLAAALFTLCALALGSAESGDAAAAKRSWAQPQIEAVVAAALLADSVAAFAPEKELTQAALGDALAQLALGSEEGALSRYRVVAPARAVTIRELDAALVAFLGLGDAARAITAQLKAAGLAPKAGAGTETVARLLVSKISIQLPGCPQFSIISIWIWIELYQI